MKACLQIKPMYCSRDYNYPSRFNQQYEKSTSNSAINNSCVGDAANAICYLSPGTTLDDIIAKFKWLYGSVELPDALMQEFYRIMQGKSGKVQAFVFHLEQALKVI